MPGLPEHEVDDFGDVLPDEFKCLIYLNVFDDMAIACPNGHNFCRGCANECSQSGNSGTKCPAS